MKRSALVFALAAMIAWLSFVMVGRGEEQVPGGGSPPPPNNPAASSSTPVSQVGFERGATGHPAGCSQGTCSDVLGLRSGAGEQVIEAHYTFATGSPGSADAGRSVANLPEIAWSIDATGAATLILDCVSCTDVDLDNERTFSNVQFVGATYQASTNRTLVTLSDRTDTTKKLTLHFSGNYSADALAWRSVLMGSAGVAEGSVTVPKGSSSVHHAFRVGTACTTPWTWK